MINPIDARMQGTVPNGLAQQFTYAQSQESTIHEELAKALGELESANVSLAGIIDSVFGQKPTVVVNGAGERRDNGGPVGSGGIPIGLVARAQQILNMAGLISNQVRQLVDKIG